jgi:hypothetical protein
MSVSVRGWKRARPETAISGRWRSSAVTNAAVLKSRLSETPAVGRRDAHDGALRRDAEQVRVRALEAPEPDAVRAPREKMSVLVERRGAVAHLGGGVGRPLLNLVQPDGGDVLSRDYVTVLLAGRGRGG